MLTDELLGYLFDGQSHILAARMAEWFASSRRFTAFVTTHQTKIRKKLRTARDPERLHDLQLELETAYLLLREKSLSLAYEPQHPREGRSPDFAVTFTTSLTFMVEVTRLRSTPWRTSNEDREQAAPSLQDRFSDTICSKLGQLLPQRSNLLLIGMEDVPLTHNDLHSVMLQLQKRAEANDPAVLQRHGFHDRADFFQHYQRLSAILLRGIPLPANEPVIIWGNPQARYALPAKVRTALSRSHTV
jgi:hypothetical protein